jgi:hypothetical protein
MPGPTHAVLFGGVTATDNSVPALGDTWVWDGVWAQQTVPGPPARQGHAMASRGGKIVLFGGQAQAVGGQGQPPPFGDTWEWDGSTWSQVAAGGPPARAYHAMAEHDGKVVLFGGKDGSGQILSDTWEWDGTAWLEKSGPGPALRYYPAMASFEGQAILQGGRGYTTVYNDTWQWDGTAWTQLQANGPQEFEHALAPVGCTIVLSGSNDPVPAGGTWYNETQIWYGTMWSPPSSGPGPTMRQWPAMAATNAGALLFGGFDNTTTKLGPLGDTWLWDGAKWALLPVSGPPARYLTAMASY